MDDKNYLINVIALSESFLENKKDELENVSTFIIKKIKKDDNTIDVTTDKMNFVSSMVDVFSNNISDYKNIEIYYLDNNTEMKYLNGISIF